MIGTFIKLTLMGASLSWAASPVSIKPVELSLQAYQSFGSVIAAGSASDAVSANMGTAMRFNRLADLQNLRPATATPNLSVFQVTPAVSNPVQVALLERHKFSTQAFIPMDGAKRYLVVVSKGDEKPDLTTLSAFVATGSQGITYKPGIWHHPIVALDELTHFANLTWEDGTSEDVHVVKLEKPVSIEIPELKNSR